MADLHYNFIVWMVFAAAWHNGNASDYDALSESGDCRFDPCGGQNFLNSSENFFPPTFNKSACSQQKVLRSQLLCPSHLFLGSFPFRMNFSSLLTPSASYTPFSAPCIIAGDSGRAHTTESVERDYSWPSACRFVLQNLSKY